MFVLKDWSTVYHRPSAWGGSLPSQSLMSALAFWPGKTAWLPQTLDRLITDQEDQSGHESTRASPRQWWMRNGRGCVEGKHIQLASRKAIRHFHKRYAICVCEATKRRVLITSFSRLENCNSEKADDFSFKKAAAWPPNPLSFHCSHCRVSGVKPWWRQVGDLGCYSLLLWVSIFPSVVVYP